MKAKKEMKAKAKPVITLNLLAKKVIELEKRLERLEEDNRIARNNDPWIGGPYCK